MPVAPAPLLAVMFRLIQGFALGGELGPVMAFLIEAAPPDRRGFVGSWQSASQSVASLVGGAVGALLAWKLSQHFVEANGWRIAFWLGALVLPFGFLIRRTLPETLHHREAPSSAHPDGTGFLAHLPVMLLGVGVIMCFTTSTYVRLNMTNYAKNALHMSAGAAYGANVVNGAAGIVFTLLGGWLSDRFGRKPAMIIPLAAFLLAVYPAFWLIVRNHDAATLWIATGVISAFSSMSTGAALIWLGEAMRKEIDDLQKENAGLRQRIEKLKNDPEAIEHEAREKLHYAKPGEVILLSPATASFDLYSGYKARGDDFKRIFRELPGVEPKDVR